MTCIFWLGHLETRYWICEVTASLYPEGMQCLRNNEALPISHASGMSSFRASIRRILAFQEWWQIRFVRGVCSIAFRDLSVKHYFDYDPKTLQLMR